MAKGYDQNIERKNTVSFYGKDLARRSKSKCELCEAAGVKLNVYEVPPILVEPKYEKCILICDNCIELIEKINKVKENDFRFLRNAIWSEVPIVKVVAISLLRKIEEKVSWAKDILEDLYIDEETEKLLEEIKF